MTNQWSCPYCQSNDIDYYNETGRCNECKNIWQCSVIYDELQLK